MSPPEPGGALPGYRRLPWPGIRVGKNGLSPTVAAEPPLSATPDADGLGTQV